MSYIPIQKGIGIQRLLLRFGRIALHSFFISVLVLLVVMLFAPKQEVLQTLQACLGLNQTISSIQGSWFEAELWNAGHVLLFFLLSYLLGRLVCLIFCIRTLPFNYILLLLVILVLSGWAVEHIQLQYGRSFAYSDIALDGFGSAAGLSLFLSIRYGFRAILSLIFITLGLSSLFSASINLYRMYGEFPVLFEQVDELSLKRFSGSSKREMTKQGNDHSLSIEFGTDRYSNLVLKEMKRDWSGYSQLVMQWYNPSIDDLVITCRIHDNLHRYSGNAIDDRFHQLVTLKLGGNRVVIDLSKVEHLSNGRHMNMNTIMALMCFSTSLDSPRQLILRKIYLR